MPLSIIAQGKQLSRVTELFMTRIDRGTILKWSERVVVSLFVAGIAVRILLGRVSGSLADEYELWWNPVAFVCIVGMGVFGYARRVKRKRRIQEGDNRETSSQ